MQALSHHSCTQPPLNHPAACCCVCCRGYTRKEPYANKFLGISWSPMAENWNGR
jgi:hypothetical protein